MASSVADLYNALKYKRYSEVRRICHDHPEYILKKISIYDDTALHMAATHWKQKDLVLYLLKTLPEDSNHQLSDVKNEDGNTVLHEVAASDAMKDAAEELLKRNADLLTASNKLGEKPIFCAARHGQIQMFKFLANKMELKKLLFFIFPSPLSVLLKHLTNKVSCMSDDDIFNRDLIERERCLQVLVTHLAQYDTSWHTSINSEGVGLGDGKELMILEAKKGQQYPQENLKSDESPLFLATMSNIEEIVKEILIFHPHAVKHTNKDGRNILHVAILYRHIDIFDMVVAKFEVLARRLLIAKDNKGNSILHMVSLKRKSQASEKMQSPAVQLRNELILFEKAKEASKTLVSKPLNNDNKTAEELFATSNEKLHQEAKEWLMRTTENCTILSVFIATVAFAAAYTVPGGPDQNKGYPMLRSKPFFAVFVLADMISITLALTSVGIFLSILTSSFRLEDFKTYLFTKLVRGIICLILSVSTMAVAFGATIVLMMARNREHVFWDVIAFLPVPIFFLSYSPLRSVLLGPFRKFFEMFIVCFILVAVFPLVYLTVGLLLVSIFPIALPFGVLNIIFFAIIFVLYGAFKGLSWAGKFICKHVRCKSGNQSQPVSDATLSPQPTNATLTDEV